MSNLNWVNKACGILLLWAITAAAVPAQTLTTLASFNGTNGEEPFFPLTQGEDGDFYGATGNGGIFGYGTIFKITPSGTLKTLYNFCSLADCADGAYPSSSLFFAPDGNFYGTCGGGGADNSGTVFKISSTGALTTLHSFAGFSAGSDPVGGVIPGTDGSFYGTTEGGGANGYGTIFQLSPNASLTTLYSFCSLSNCLDGKNPERGVIEARNGILYGVTTLGGIVGDGTVFSITPGGQFTLLSSLSSRLGIWPTAGLIQATDGNLYGTALYGGYLYQCEKSAPKGCGTLFKVSSSGIVSMVYYFCPQWPCKDGSIPAGGVVQGTDGNFYGIANQGGTDHLGAVFSLTPGGVLTALHSFHGTDGENPAQGLTQGTDGRFYGTTPFGSEYGLGSVFVLSVGLGPFVEMQPTSGKVGAAVRILGTNLTGATSVTFNGTAAIFTVNSHSLITTTVPVGATSGTVQVVTPSSGTLSSNVIFRVRP